ncbi:MAG: hypothetical protein Q8N47_08360, partial [Bryobacterales bacterium]|nr:hypothetical protein [Bryobacterales bacterium]
PAPAAPSHPAAPGPPPAAVTPATPTPAPGFKFPSLGQTGRLAAITGGFSGDHSLTEGRIGGKEMDIRAISPRKLVFSNRRDVIGPTQIELKEKGQVIRSPYRSVDLALRATKTRMKPSETATLYTDLRGLAGLATPLTIAHQNLSPAVVRLPGGTHPKVTLLPSQVGPGGVATIPLTLVAVRTGGFTIRVSCTGETDDDCDKLYQEMEEKKAEATKRRVEAEAKKALAAKADKGGPGSYRDAARGKQAEADRKKAVAVKADGNAARAEAVNDSRQAARSRANARTINAEATKLEGEAKEANDTADALEKEGVPDDLRGRSAAAKRLKAEAKDAEDRAKDLEQDVGKLREAYDKCRKGI